MPQKPKSKRVIKGIQSREKIIKKALKMAAKQGFMDLSFQKIADACNLSQSALLHHFPSKDHLIQAVLGQILAHNQETVKSTILISDNALVRLNKHFSGNLQWAIDYPEEAQVIALLYYYASFESHFTALYRTVLVEARKKIAELIYAGIRERCIVIDLKNVEVWTEIIHDALLGSILNLVCSGSTALETTNVKKRWEKLLQTITSTEKSL